MNGEYIGKIYHEVKKRPRCAIEKDLFSHQMIEQKEKN
ncbi:hypothetical protein BACCIP111895_00117 [Neobacillus rhizosphaerae]|uniref:Uncharacterized protein n=1 Tax=Neobacillus rhizosphaerae TaxID=2880965 RepID=A0ABN8KLR5_9BACI|nr:hypothetical protein BACCIP111895_00117 [Neobacillus rhizosphaerae]